MAPVDTAAQSHRAGQAAHSRKAWADNLKVVLVIGVIVTHVTIAWTDLVVHQIVLVGLVLASHAVVWPPEAEWLTVSALGVLVSFGVGALVTRIPAVGRFF